MSKHKVHQGRTLDFKQQYQTECRSCRGKQVEVDGSKCYNCEGHGVVPTPEGMAILQFVKEFKKWL